MRGLRVTAAAQCLRAAGPHHSTHHAPPLALLSVSTPCGAVRGVRPQRRWLTGTVSMLPMPQEPWAIQGGKEWAKGETEDNYTNEVTRPGNAGDDVDALCGYLEKGEVVVVEEDWDTCAAHYAGVLAAYERQRMTDVGRQGFATDMLTVAGENFMTTYPNQGHLDELHEQAHRGLARVRRYRKRYFPNQKELYPSFHMWCHAHYPPEQHQTIAIGELVRLRDSYRRYLEGVRVLRLDERVRGKGADGTRLQDKLNYYYRPLHGVRLPHAALVDLFFERLEEGRDLRRVERVMEVGCESGVLSLMMRQYGMGSALHALTDPRPQNLNSVKLNLRNVGGIQRKALKKAANPQKRYRVRHYVTPSRTSLPHPRKEGDTRGLGVNDNSAPAAAMAAAPVGDAGADASSTDLVVRPSGPRPDVPFHLIVHTVDPNPEETLATSVRPTHEEALSSILAFLQEADRYLAPCGRVVVLCDNLSLLETGNDPIDALLEHPDLAGMHDFTVEAVYVKPFVQCSDLENPMGATDLSVRQAIKQGRTGLRADDADAAELPPGPLRQHVRVNNVMAHVLGKKPRNYGTKYGTFMRHLGWSEIDKLNTEKYTPEVEDDVAEQRKAIQSRLVGRLLILRRRSDPDYRLVNLGQQRDGGSSAQDTPDLDYDDIDDDFEDDGAPF